MNEAWWLLECVTKKTKAALLAQDIIPTDVQQAELQQLVRRRVEGNEPLQYLIGSMEFCDLTLSVQSPTFIPRPETEEWCHRLINQLTPHAKNALTILDLCTGSGAIGLALAHHLPQAHVTLVDKERHAFDRAQINAENNDLTNVRLLHGDLFQPVQNETASFDLIVSNPPYVTAEEWESMDVSIKDWEHETAFVANLEGLAVYEKLIENATSFLSADSPLNATECPRIVLEIGTEQAAPVIAMLTESGFSNIRHHKDLAGIDRWITASL